MLLLSLILLPISRAETYDYECPTEWACEGACYKFLSDEPRCNEFASFDPEEGILCSECEIYCPEPETPTTDESVDSFEPGVDACPEEWDCDGRCYHYFSSSQRCHQNRVDESRCSSSDIWCPLVDRTPTTHTTATSWPSTSTDLFECLTPEICPDSWECEGHCYHFLGGTPHCRADSSSPEECFGSEMWCEPQTTGTSLDSNPTDESEIDSNPTDESEIDSSPTDDISIDSNPGHNSTANTTSIDSNPTDDISIDSDPHHNTTDDATSIDSNPTDESEIDSNPTDDISIDSDPHHNTTDNADSTSSEIDSNDSNTSAIEGQDSQPDPNEINTDGDTTSTGQWMWVAWAAIFTFCLIGVWRFRVNRNKQADAGGINGGGDFRVLVGDPVDV